LWIIASLGFRIYIANFGRFSETYGFVGAILVLLLWMYLTGITILVGGEAGAEMERTD
jgi:membrane protein